MLIANKLSHIIYHYTVDESDIGKVELSQNVIINADVFPGKRFSGKIERIVRAWMIFITR